MRWINALRRESPLTLAREALWRTHRQWRQHRLREHLGTTWCPVRYSPVGYYKVPPNGAGDRSRDSILRYADAVCSGRFPSFGYGAVQLGLPPRWNFDFVSGGTWSEAQANTIQVVRHDGSDVKVPWELSRLQFMPVLGKAWRLSGENRYRLAARRLLHDWMEKNPAGMGVNWTVAMEAALRAISVCFALELLASEHEQEGDPWQREVTRSLWQHLLFIEAYNEFSYLSRGNHYLSNLLGLFCLSSFLQGPGMEQRRRMYQRLLEREILVQVYDDGGDYEASSGYHLLNLQMFTSALLLMRAQNMEPGPEFAGRLRSMYQFLSALADQRGHVPHLGDCDDGRVELLSDDLEHLLGSPSESRHSLTVSSSLGVGEALLKESFGGRTDDVAWYGLVPNSREEQCAGPVGRRCLVFPNSGLAIARVSTAEVIFSAMPNGIDGKGSHTHNDKLSVVVRIDGNELLSDSGTGCYTRDFEMRNRFRSTAAHNTVQIDGEEQNRFSTSPHAVFRICDDAHVTPIALEDAGEGHILRASHDGYSRLGVVHTRRVELAPGLLTLEDQLSGSGSHTFEARFHLRALWKVDVQRDTGTQVQCRIQGPDLTAHLSCQAPVELEMLCRAGEGSTAYGVTRKTKQILVRGRFLEQIRLLSYISWELSGSKG
jgi:uncharacterized heparinase superfamily protein